MHGLGEEVTAWEKVVVDREKNNFCSTTTTARLVLPSELFSVEEVMKELHAAVAGLKTPGLDKTEVMRLRGIIAGCKVYKEMLADYLDYRGLELELLSKVGLNDAFLFLRTYSQLSDGQKYRYRIAKLIESGKQWWLMDEFAACLDRDTAKIIAFNLQKIARQQGKAVVAATTHGDLFEDLNPSVHVHKRFGQEIHVNYYANEPASECSLVREMRVELGTIKDWHGLSGFHYRGHLVAGPRKVFRLVRGEELCGVIVYCYPPPSCFGRRLVLPHISMQELNEKLSIINRVVIHPKYRTIGLGARIIRETLRSAGTPYVEMVAVMAKYNPFAEKAGLEKIVEQQPLEGILRIADFLSASGFSLSLLGSECYVQQKISGLSPEAIGKLKELFKVNKHQRFRKEFAVSRHQPFGKTGDYISSINNCNHIKLAKLIRIVGVLSQTKIYLFWNWNEPIFHENQNKTD